MSAQESTELAPISPKSVTATQVPSKSNAVACDSCKRLKRKCDRQRPTCSRCRVSGMSCQYAQQRRRPGPAKGTVSARTRFLVDRINQLEGVVQCLSDQNSPAVSWPSPMGVDMSAVFSPPMSLPGEPIVESTSFEITAREELAQWTMSIPTEEGTLTASTHQLLISLYFDHIQPTFPMFRKPVFYQQLITQQIPDYLLTAILAISARFLPEDKIAEIFGETSSPWEDLSQSAQQKFRQEMQCSNPVTLEHVKTACILALYEYTTAPSRQAWILVGNAMRLALMAQLHQIDCRPHSPVVSDGDKEEWRFVWWTIWRLDCTVNVTSVTPFGVDPQMIGTALISTTVANFTAGLVGPSRGEVPEMDPVKAWTSVAAMQIPDPGDGFNLHLFAVSLLRAVSECQQRLNIRANPEEIRRVASLEEILSSLHLILPDWFYVADKRPTEDQHSHRLRLETVIMLHTTRLIIHEPVHNLIMAMELSPDSRLVSLKSWTDSISYAQRIADIFNHWPTTYFAVSDPIISCAIWHASCALTLYGMSGLDISAPDSKATKERALDSLRTSLQRFTPWWPIARVLQDSLQTFQAWSWATLDVRKLVDLIAHTRKVFSPYTPEPGRVDMSVLCDAVIL